MPRALLLCLTLVLTATAFAQDEDAATRMVREAEAVRARQMTGFHRASDRTAGGIQGAIRDAYAVAPGETRAEPSAEDEPKRDDTPGHSWLPWVLGAIGAAIAAKLLAKLWKRLA